MNTKEAAAALDKNQYREEGSRELFAQMKAAGLVAVYGASDDLMEFDGAIRDEIGAPGTAYLNSRGLMLSECEEGDECPYFLREREGAATIEALWDRDGFSFVYETSIPHETFVILEDEEMYCRGIVFALEDIP